MTAASLVLATVHVPGLAEHCGTCDARSGSICAAIDDADLHRLAKAAHPAQAGAGQTFIYEGDPAANFYNISGGHARLFKLLPDGRRQITGFARAGHFLGLAVNEAYSFSAEAIDMVSYCRIPRASMHALLDNFPAMERRLLESAGNELVSAQEQMLLLGRKTARERLASFIVAQSRLDRPCRAHTLRLPLPMTRGDIADYLGLTIETVSRTFTRLKSERLIDLPGPHEVVIRDFEALDTIAGGFAAAV